MTSVSSRRPTSGSRLSRDGLDAGRALAILTDDDSQSNAGCDGAAAWPNEPRSMTPRHYAQDKRAGTAAETRHRILDAAMAVYRERGIEAARLAEIAARADVSRGTIVNHFGGSDGLLAAVLDEVLTSLDVPDEGAIDPSASDEERIRQFLDAWLRFYDRSGEWWAVFADERHNLPAIPALQAKERQF